VPNVPLMDGHQFAKKIEWMIGNDHMKKDVANEVWVMGDLRNQKFFDLSLRALSKARDLVGPLGGKAAVVLFDVSEEKLQNTSGLVPVLAEKAIEKFLVHGADRVYVIKHGSLTLYGADVCAFSLAEAVKERRPALVLFALTEFGREMAAMSARLCSAGLISDCQDLRMEDKQIIGTCPAWGGEIMAEISFSDIHEPGFATIQANLFPSVEAKGDPGEVIRINLVGSGEMRRAKLLSLAPEPGDEKKLEEAKVVVVGGAGLGDMEGFGLARELASAVEGEIGATRPPVLHHWVEEERLIGQTGKTVRPDLLFSIGTSGAVQYTAGIMDAKTIVAVNRDPHASIFQVADLGIVADARTFLPLLTARIKQSVMRGLADVLSEDKGVSGKSRFGEKIRSLREGNNWSVEALAKATGQTPEFVEQVESDEISPPVSFLVSLAGALDIDPGTFLHKEEKAAIRDQRAKAFYKRTKSYSYETLTPGAENNHLRAFMITIESQHDHKPVEYKHEGEEFIFVMEGDLQFTLGGKVHVLKEGECIHFNSDIPHKLKSLSNDPTRCLVMLYTV